MNTTKIDRWRACWDDLLNKESPFALGKDGKGLKYFSKAPANLAEALQRGREHSDKPFLTWMERSYTYAEFFDAADRLTTGLKTRFKTQPGDRIGIAMRNRPEWMIAFVAIAQCGAIPVAINSWGKEDELLHVIQDSGLSVLFCDAQRRVIVGNKAPGVELITVDKESPQCTHSWSALLELEPEASPLPAVTGEDSALLLYTSGTTSRAKGVISSHKAVCQAIYALEFQSAFAALISPERIEPIIKSGLQPTVLLAYPMFHVSGIFSQFIHALRSGNRLVILYKWDVQEALRTIKQEQVTQFNGVPTMVQQLVSHERFSSSDTDSLFSLGMGGSAATKSLLRKLLEVKPLAMSGTGYGMTESNGICAAHSGEQFIAFPESSGWPLPIVDIAIGDTPEQTNPPGEAGPIWLQTSAMMKHYLNATNETSTVFKNDWFFSGDVGYIDEYGLLYIVDRIKDIIIRGGENISAVEVEHCALEHPDVEEAAAFSLPDSEYGEAVGLAVVSESSLEEDDLLSFMSGLLAKYKLPKFIWFFDRPFPRSATGKLKKADIKAALSEN